MAILRVESVKAELGHVSIATVYNYARAGLLTKSVRFGARATGWPDYEVRAVVAARTAGKTDDEIRELVKQLHAQRAQLAPTILPAAALAGVGAA